MYCSNCGKEVQEKDLFCAACGTKLIHIVEIEEQGLGNETIENDLVEKTNASMESRTETATAVTKRKRLGLKQMKLGFIIKTSIIVCLFIGLIIRAFSLWYLHSSSWITIHPSFYLSLIPAILFPVFLIVLTMASDKLMGKWTVGIMYTCVFAREIYLMFSLIRRGIEVVQSHLKDLADDSYRIGGYEKFYRDWLLNAMIALGIIIGFILVLFFKKERTVLLGVIIAVLGCIVVYDACNCFSRKIIEDYYSIDRIYFYDKLMSNLLEMAICLFGIWVCIRKRVSEKI